MKKLAISFLILLYLSVLLFQYLHFDFNQMFGYLDPQLYWQGLSDFAAGKIIYRDFYWEYGFLYLALGLPFFLLLGKTFLASVLVRLLILPIISIFLSVLIGKELLKKWPLILFLFLLFLYEVNNTFTSLRHLLPELGLIILVISLEKNNRKKAFLGSFLLGLSLMSSIEYGAAAIISIGFYFLIASFKKQIRSVFNQILGFSSVTAIVAVPYFFFLWKVGALKNFITFTFEYAKSFYYNSPCRELFPRLNELFPNLINFCQRLNLYFVPFILIILLGWAITKRKAKWFPIITPLLIYSLLIFYRTLNTPCVGYLNYGLTFLFLILLYMISLTKSLPKFRLILLLVTSWFLIVGFLSNTSKFIRTYKMIVKNQEVSQADFLPVVGVKLRKELAQEYQQITNFIKKNSKGNDYIYVYPNGPYNQLADRKSPVSVASTWYYDLVPSLVETTFQQLTQRKPKLMIVNIYNARSLKSALNNVSYNFHSEDKDIIFEGITTSVEDFIAQNYEISKKFELAWVLTKKDKPKLAKKLYLPASETPEWKISTQGLSQNQHLVLSDSIYFEVNKNNPLIQIHSKIFNKTDLMKIPIKVDLGISKMFSKFIVEVYANTNDGKSYLLNRQLATSDWQDVWAYLPKTENSFKIASITILLSDNKGFFWWGKPKNIEFKQPELFILNKNLKLDDSAFK